MNKKLWYIQQLELFKGLEPTILAKIDLLMGMRQYCKRELVFEPGDKDKVLIVKTGQVELYQLTKSGKKVIIDRLSPGSVFGDLGTETPQEVFVEATTDSYICSMNKNDFFAFVSRYPKLAEKLMRNLFSRLLLVERRFSSVATDTALERIVKLFLQLGKRTSDTAMEISSRFTHEELAQMLGISRQTVTTLINQLEKQGLITRKQKHLKFNKDRLEQLTS